MPIEVHGLTEIIQRMQEYPAKLNQAMGVTMNAALLILWENVPPYPNQPNGSTYERTGGLGRSLGSGEGGGQSSGHPDIYDIRPLGAGSYEGHFGSSLEYAKYVIGDDTQSVRLGYWWTMSTIVKKATDKILRIFADLGQQMANFLEHG